MKEVLKKIDYEIEEMGRYDAMASPRFDGYIKGLEKAKQIIQSNSGWTPVSERLPSKEECTDDNGEDARFIVTNKFGRVLECNYYDGFTAKWIIAWQPLPEPYQPKGE